MPRGPGELWSYQAGYGLKPLALGGRGVGERGNQWLHFETVKDFRLKPNQWIGF